MVLLLCTILLLLVILVFPCIPLFDLVWTFFFIGGDSWDGRVQGNCFCEIDF